MEMYFIPNKGIHRLTITDTRGFHSFGPEDQAAPEKAVIRFTDRYDRPLGFYGSWKYDGLASLGLITMNTQCLPRDGDYVDQEVPDPAKEVVYVEVIKVTPAPPAVIVEVPIETTVIKEVEVVVEKEVQVEVPVEVTVPVEVPVEVEKEVEV